MSRRIAGWLLLAGLALPEGRLACAERQKGGTDAPLPAGALARLGTARFQNVGRVFSVAFSPDGKMLASAAWDGSIRLWDPARGKLLREFTGHDGWVWSIAFSPDGQTLASGGKDGIIRLWQVPTGKPIRRFPACPSQVASVAFSPAGRTLLSRCKARVVGRFVETAVRLWDVAMGQMRHEVRNKSPLGGEIYRAAAFSPDGKTLATATGRTVRMWEAATGKQLRKVVRLDQSSWLVCPTFSADGRMLAARVDSLGARLESNIRVWDLGTGKEMPALATPGYYGPPLAFSADGRLLASASGGDDVRILELATGRERCRFRGPDWGTVPLAFSPDGRVLAAGSRDVTVLLWDLTGRLRQGKLVPADLTPAELQSLWADLKGTDAARAHRAVWTLAASPAKSLAFLKERFRPIAPADPRRTATLLADLDSARYTVRVRAAAELEKLGVTAEPALRKALEGEPSVELRRRVEQVLRKLEVSDNLRTLRAVEVLEHAGTLAARRLLRALAGGAPAGHRTREARKVLTRLPLQTDHKP